MPVFSNKDTFQSFVDLVWERTSVQHGFKQESECSGVVWGRRQVVDFATGIERMRTGADGYRVAWTAWCRQNMADAIPSKLMFDLLAAMAESDPVVACKLYLAEPTLSDRESTLLWKSFTERQSGNLTSMKHRIESGVIKTAKETGIIVRL